MKVKLLISLILILISNAIFCQQKVEDYLQLVMAHQFNHPDSASYFLQLAEKNCEDKKSTNYRKILSVKGLIRMNSAEFREAAIYFDSAASLALKLKDTLKFCEMLDNEAQSLRNANRYVESFSTYFNALKYANDDSRLDIKSDLLNGIGVSYDNIFDHENALKYYRLSIQASRKLQDKYKENNTILNMSYALTGVGKIDSSNFVLQDIIHQNMPFERNPENASLLFDVYHNLGTNYTAQKKYDSSIRMYKKALEIERVIPTGHNLYNTYVSLAIDLMMNKNTTAAKLYIDSVKMLKPEFDNIIGKLGDYYFQYRSNQFYGKHQQAYAAIDSFMVYRDSMDHLNSNPLNQRDVIRYELAQKSIADSLRMNQQLLEAKTNAISNQNKFLMALLATIIMLGGIAWYWQRNKNLKKKNVLIHQEKLLAENQLSIQQLKTLQAQMNPHFIFNCFNTIDSFILQNKKLEATKLVQAFSKLTRNILDLTSKNEITLQEEIDMLDNYVQTENLRSPGIFEWKLEIPHELEDCKIPPMLLQPFIENAIVHGVRSLKDRKGMIQLSAENHQNEIRIRIADNGVGMKNQSSTTTHTSMSMKLTVERLSSLNKGKNLNEYFNLIKGLNDQGIIVELSIPLKR